MHVQFDAGLGIRQEWLPLFDRYGVDLRAVQRVGLPPPQCRVITAVGPVPAGGGKRPPVYVQEDAPWSAVRDEAHS